jgi:hypothetical protein
MMHAIAFRPVVNLIDEGKNEDNAGAGSGRADGRCDDRRVGRCDGAVGRQRNGGSGRGNAHGAATAGPTVGGDNTSTPGSTRQGSFHSTHKKKAKPATTTQ